jgi:hypothetical protein
MVAGFTFANSTSNPTSSSGKRKDVQQSSQKIKKKKGCRKGIVIVPKISVAEINVRSKGKLQTLM